MAVESAEAPPRRVVAVISRMFTPLEWLAVSGLFLAHKEADALLPELDWTMRDVLMWGARYLQERGYAFKGFSISDDDEVVLKEDRDMGGAPALYGMGPYTALAAAESLLLNELPDATDDLDMVRSLQDKAQRMGNAWLR